MKVYSVTIEGMTTYFGTKREARRFNRHDEPEAIETHKFNPDELAEFLNSFSDSPSSVSNLNRE